MVQFVFYFKLVVPCIYSSLGCLLIKTNSVGKSNGQCVCTSSFGVIDSSSWYKSIVIQTYSSIKFFKSSWNSIEVFFCFVLFFLPHYRDLLCKFDILPFLRKKITISKREKIVFFWIVWCHNGALSAHMTFHLLFVFI